MKMMKNNKCNCNKNCDCQNSQSSGFIFGLILGSILGAIIAVVIYKNNKTKIFSNLREKLENFLGSSSGRSKQKKEKNIQKVPKIIKKPKTFLKPKKHS